VGSQVSATTHIRIHRMNLPPVLVPSGELIDAWSTYATVSAGDITADVERVVSWDPRDNEPEPAVLFEVRINGLPETCGTADIVSNQPTPLCDLACVCIQAAQLLVEAKALHKNGLVSA
jgi:hypothetical protein